MASEFEKMIAGQPYSPSDPELVAARTKARLLIREFNQMSEDRQFDRSGLLRRLLGKTRREFHIESTFSVDYGFNISIGENFYANFNCTMLDVCPITIGDNVMIAPNVSLYTATHPIDPNERNSGIEYGKPISIGHNVWIGGNAVILPGVTLGDNVVVGAGSVVTKSFPANVVIAGNPAVVIKQIPPSE